MLCALSDWLGLAGCEAAWGTGPGSPGHWRLTGWPEECAGADEAEAELT